jgi:hypothetical protein
VHLPATMQGLVEALNPAVDPNPLEPARSRAAVAHLATTDTVENAVASGAGEERRWIPSLHSLVVALLLGVAGGGIAAIWLTLIEVAVGS